MKRETQGWAAHLDIMILDLLCFQVSFALVYVLKFGWESPYIIRHWRNLVIVMSLIDVMAMTFGNTFHEILHRGYLKEMIAMAKQVAYLELSTIFYMYAIHESINYSRVVVLYTGLVYLVLAFCVRAVWKQTLLSHFSNRKQRLLLIGSSDFARRFYQQMQSSMLNKRAIISAYLADAPCADIEGYAGTISLLETYLKTNEFDKVIATTTAEEAEQLIHIVELCELYGVRISVIPFYNDVISSNARIEQAGTLKLLNVRAIPLDNMANAMVKRCFDILCSVILLLLFSPVMFVAAVGTKLSSPGPIFFKQERVGRDKRTYTMLKFRSMRITGTETTGWSTNIDPRKTRLGSFLRKFSIDELPQLFNVLVGQMSIIGPRPEVPFHVEHFMHEIPLYMVRHHIRPGITGWAQINGLRGDTSIVERVKCDIWYIENWSFSLDLKIIFRTVFGGMINAEKVRSDLDAAVNKPLNLDTLLTGVEDRDTSAS